jgi:fibronectin type 3 domain-containing protein
MSFAGCAGSDDIPPANILTSGKVTLAWNDLPGAAGYNVYISTSPGVTVLNSYKISNVTNPITIGDLEPNTTYYFIVTVEDNSGQSQKSKEVSYKAVVNTKGWIQFDDFVSHSGTDITVRTPDVTLTWDDVPNATSYNIYWSNLPGVTKKNGTKISNVKNPHKITGLKKGKKYYFVVTAVNASSESKESEELSLTVEQ